VKGSALRVVSTGSAGSQWTPYIGVAKLFTDMEAVYTYEGPDTMQALIVGEFVE